MKLLWIYKEALKNLIDNPIKPGDIPEDQIFYGTVEEVKEFEKFGYSKFSDWKMFFSFES